MVHITESQVYEFLKMKDCIDLMRETLALLSKGEAIQVLRNAIKLKDGNIFGVMPAAIEPKHVAGAKLITVFHENFKKKLPSHQGEIVLFETITGKLKGIVNGDAITGIRTAAVSAVATDLLSKKDAKILALLGAGLQSRKHLEAILLVRDVKEVNIWDIYPESAIRFAADMEKVFKVKINIKSSTKDAVENADIICTLTPAKDPILFGVDVKEGAHINAVGACTPNCRELDSELVKDSKFYGDKKDSVINESGDYLIPLKEGVIAEKHYLGDIGDLITGTLNGRTKDSDITIFEALGLAVEDIAAADFILEKYFEQQNTEIAESVYAD